MAKDKRQKAKKTLRNKAVLMAGVFGSSIVLISSAVNLVQTYRGNSTPQRILDVKSEIDRSWKALAESDDLEEKREIKIDLEEMAKAQQLGATWIASQSLSDLFELEQALSYPQNISPDELEQLLNYLDVSLWRSFRYFLIQKNLTIESSLFLSRALSQQDFERDLKLQYLGLQDFEQYLELRDLKLRDFEQDFERYLELRDLKLRYLKYDFEQAFGKNFELRDFELRDFERAFEQDLKQYFEQYFEQDLRQYFGKAIKRAIEEDFELWNFELWDFELWDTEPMGFEEYFAKQLILLKFYL